MVPQAVDVVTESPKREAFLLSRLVCDTELAKSADIWEEVPPVAAAAACFPRVLGVWAVFPVCARAG